MRGAKAFAAVALSGLAIATASGCGGSGTSATPSRSLTPAALDLKNLAATSTKGLFSATYAATVDKQSLTVAVYIQDSATYRVDIAQNGTVASLYGTPSGSIACTTAAGVAPTCFLVAAPGKAIPAPYDAGVERIFTRDLPAIATNVAAFSVATKDSLQAEGTLPTARCFSIAVERDKNLFTSGLLDDVDLGTYCLSDSGPPRRLDFASGSLILQSVGPAPTAEQLTPPAAAIPLPSPTATPTTSASAPLGLLGSSAPKS